MSTARRKIRNRIIILLNHLGLQIGPIYLLTVAGRHSGLPRTTPVAPVIIDNVRYVIEAYPKSNWVRNARAAGHGVLTRGHRAEEVDLMQLTVPEAAEVLRAFPAQNPRGVAAFTRNSLVDAATPDAFAAAADRCPVFRLTPCADATHR